MKPLKVSQINNYIARLVDNDPLIGQIAVIGEVSNLSYSNSGHVYFSIKDETSTLRCVLFASRKDKLPQGLKNGIEIIVTGKISVYENGGYYSLQVWTVKLAGEGLLAIKFEELKQKLAEEGLFDESHKKALPAFPRKVALVTAEGGAAVKDMVKIIRQRNDIVDILIYPVLVQGDMAANEIAEAIYDLNANFDDIDVMIVGRGGGSKEDLWAFNEEIVARAIYASEIPVISAVGHEIDVSISDFVADARAATPTAAGSIAVPDVAEIKHYIERQKQYLDNYLDMCAERVKTILKDVENYRKELDRHLNEIFEKNRQALKFLKQRLDSLNPKKIIEKGYGALLDENRNIILSIQELQEGKDLNVLMSDGELIVTVKKILN